MRITSDANKLQIITNQLSGVDELGDHPIIHIITTDIANLSLCQGHPEMLSCSNHLRAAGSELNTALRNITIRNNVAYVDKDAPYNDAQSNATERAFLLNLARVKKSLKSSIQDLIGLQDSGLVNPEEISSIIVEIRSHEEVVSQIIADIGPEATNKIHEIMGAIESRDVLIKSKAPDPVSYTVDTQTRRNLELILRDNFIFSEPGSRKRVAQEIIDLFAKQQKFSHEGPDKRGSEGPRFSGR